MIASSLLVIGLDNALCGKKAFINLGRGLLVDGFSLMLPKESTVIEVLENVEPDSEMLAACERLRRQGYPIALDDFVGTPNNEPLAALANLIKVDFRRTPSAESSALCAPMKTAIGPKWMIVPPDCAFPSRKRAKLI